MSRKTLPFLLILVVLAGCGSGVRDTDPLPAAINNKTVFLGDSITYFWDLPKHNAGIPGQNTAQIESRFQTAVVQSGLPQVIILTGANDVRVTDPDYSGVMANIQKMVAQGKAAGITVILCELTPITCCDTQVQTLNAMIKEYATSQGLTLVDYYTPMAGKDSMYLKDGLHPNTLGYSVMAETLTKSFQPAS
jgi:lysophospholipase L1-like esterase